jgi:RNA polymerase sigma factor (sigma-70 family)
MAPAADQPPCGLTPGGRPVADSDAELLGRIAKRDRDAFETFYLRYVRAVYALALHRLGERADAEEATRRTFAAIWGSSAAPVPERGDGPRWLFTVAENTIGDQAASRAHSVSRDEVPGDKPQAGPGPAAEDGWSLFRVHAAVMGLPEQERVPIELLYWEGRSQSEIAKRLGLSIGTVKARTLRALEHLARRLERLR